MASIGQFVKAYMPLPNGTLSPAGRGYIVAIGDNRLQLETPHGNKRIFPLNLVVIEKLEAEGHDHTHCRPGAQAQIKNKATGNGYTNKKLKAHFDKRSVWDSSREYNEQENCLGEW